MSLRRDEKYLEKRLAEVRQRRDFIRSGVPNIIDDGEEEAAADWWINHSCFTDRATWEHVIEIQSFSPNIFFGQTSIGSTIIIVCPYCEEHKDVTDYGRW